MLWSEDIGLFFNCIYPSNKTQINIMRKVFYTLSPFVLYLCGESRQK